MQGVDKKERKYKKPSNLFFITLPRCSLERNILHDMLKNHISQIVVSRELHNDLSYHLHIFVKTIDTWLLSELRSYIVDIFNDFDIDIPIDI